MRRILVLIAFIFFGAAARMEAACDPPQINATYNGPSGTGAGTLSVAYNFPGTTSYTQRTLSVYLDGAAWPNYFALTKPSTSSGTWTITLNARA